VKIKCPKCGTGKARRTCPREGNAEICSECCATIRDAECGDCVHYAPAQKHEKSRAISSGLPDGHFIIELNPELEKSVNDALDQAQRGNTQKAMTTLTGLLHDHPRSHVVAFGVGGVHALQREYEESIKWFDKAIAIYPYSIESHYNKAVSYQKLLDIPNCIRAYQKVVQFGEFSDPEVAQARSIITYLTNEIFKKEGIQLDNYLRSMDLFNQGFALMERNDFQSALEGFRASADINKRNVPCQGNMGLCYAYLGQKAEALAALDRALEIDPDYRPARENRRLIEKMEESVPLANVEYESINYGFESFNKERR
jgi:tetratricopeptide (TPR) repeat protein